MDFLAMQVAKSRHDDMLREAAYQRRASQIVRANRAKRAEGSERRLMHFGLGKLHVDVTLGRPTPVAQM